jgi:hypothetical protein
MGEGEIEGVREYGSLEFSETGVHTKHCGNSGSSVWSDIVIDHTTTPLVRREDEKGDRAHEPKDNDPSILMHQREPLRDVVSSSYKDMSETS